MNRSAYWFSIALLLMCSYVFPSQALAQTIQPKQSTNTLELSEAPGIEQLKMRPMAGLTPEQCHQPGLNDSQWQSIQFHRIKPQQHLCIRGMINVTQENLPDNPALFLAALAAYEIRINGQFIGKNGVPGPDKNKEKVGTIGSLLQLDSSRLQPGEHMLSIELSSFLADPSFAAVSYILIITDQQSLSDIVLKVSLVAAFFIGGLAILFLIFLVLYLRFNRDTSVLIFSLLCLFTGTLLVAEQWKLWVNYRYDWHLTRLTIVMALTIIVTTLLPWYYLLHHNLSRKKYWLLAVAISYLITGLLTQSYDARSEGLFIVCLLFVIVINIVANRLKRPYVKTALAISVLSLIGLFLAPRLYIELGFSLSVCLVVGCIGLSLINSLTRQRDMALETGRVKGELLRRNLQPHYLMNCLMQVQELIDIAPAQANEFVAELANEFRALVQITERDVVSLADEINLCLKHLKIMSLRYQHDYELVIVDHHQGQNKRDTDFSMMNFPVPTAIIHSQIENCFTHNRIAQNQQIRLVIKATDRKISMELQTPIATSANHQGLGIGESYIRAKMEEVCEPGWQLQSFEKNGVWVTLYEYKMRSQYKVQDQYKLQGQLLKDDVRSEKQ